MSRRGEAPVAASGRRRLLVLLAVLLLLAGWARVRPLVTPTASPPPPLTADSSQASCTPEDLALRVGRGSVRPDGARLATAGLAALRVCEAGRLQFTLGSNVPGATMLVARGVDPVWLGTLDAPVPLSVALDGPSWVAVAYLNDGTVEGRNRDAWIRDLHFEPAH